MTLRKWIAFGSAAAMLAGVGACKDTGGGSSAGTSPAGRRSDTLPRARGADAGSDMSTSPGTTSPSSTTAPTSPTSPTTTPSSPPPSSGSSSDTKR